MKLTGQRALVTGGAVRLGRAISLALAGAGCDVAIHYGRSAESAESARREVEALGRRAVAIPADLADAGAPEALLAAAVSGLGGIEILVNNAAIYPEADLLGTSAGLWDRLHAVNLRAPFLLVRELVARLPADATGVVVNILDGRVFRPGADHLAYRATKDALAGLTRHLALALAPRIRVNGVAPGAVLPPPGATDEELTRLAAAEVPLGRPGDPGAIARAVVYLATEPFLTGVLLPVDGGQYL